MASVESSSEKKRGDNQRFTDVGKEPDKILPPLPPITKLHSNTSSLQEALKPVHHLVEDLPNRVVRSLERCKNPKDGLTLDESAAIFLYTQQWPPGKISFYTMFNRTLRDDNRAKLVPFYPYLNFFMSAFNKLPSIQDRVWRGETGDWSDQYQQGTIHVWWAVSSCTDMIRVTGDFLDQKKKRTLFNIKCMNGKIIKNHSEFPDESETVLPPGTYLKVKSSLKATPDLCIVDLEEVIPTPGELAQLTTGATSSTILSNPQVGNIDVLWLDPNVNKSQQNKKIQEKLKHIFNHSFKSLEQLEETVNYIRDKQNECLLLITGGQIGRQIVPRVNDFSQLQSIVIFCMDKQANEQWSRDYEKVKAVVIQEDKMIEIVQKLHKNLAEQQKSLSSSKVKSSSDKFNDATNESPKMLSPFDGLKDLPLCPLQESLQGLTDVIPDVQEYVKVAMHNCEKPSEGLTRDESAAIMIYTMEWEPSESCLYRLLNQDLRSESRHALKKWSPYLRLFVHALNKLPSYKGTVWRGIPSDIANGYQIGQTVIWWGVSTATSNMSILESGQFMGQHGSRTLFSIECQNGKRIGQHSYFSSEEEIILLPGTHFEVTSRLDAGNGLHMINLRETDSPYPLN